MTQLVAESTFDKVKNYYLGNIEALPEAVEAVRKRWQTAFTHKLEGGLKSDREVVEFLKKEYNISEAQAYRDIANANLLFGDVRKSNKECERYIASENAKAVFAKAMKMFEETKNIDWYYVAIEQQKIHYKVNVLEKDDPDLPDASKINPPTQILQINIDFLTSRFADIIDDKAKEKINNLLQQIQTLVEKNKISDYLDNTIEIPYMEIKNDKP